MSALKMPRATDVAPTDRLTRARPLIRGRPAPNAGRFSASAAPVHHPPAADTHRSPLAPLSQRESPRRDPPTLLGSHFSAGRIRLEDRFVQAADGPSSPALWINLYQFPSDVPQLGVLDRGI